MYQFKTLQLISSNFKLWLLHTPYISILPIQNTVERSLLSLTVSIIFLLFWILCTY